MNPKDSQCVSTRLFNALHDQWQVGRPSFSYTVGQKSLIVIVLAEKLALRSSAHFQSNLLSCTPLDDRLSNDSLNVDNSCLLDLPTISGSQRNHHRPPINAPKPVK